MRKKAQLQVPGTLVDFYSYVVFVLILLLFILLFQLKKCDSENPDIGTKAFHTDVNIILMNYLKSSVVVEGNELSVADIISMVDIEEGRDERAKAFQQTAKEFIEPQFPQENSAWGMGPPWRIGIFDHDEKLHPSLLKSKFEKMGYEYCGSCDMVTKMYDYNVEIQVPKINGGYAKIIFSTYNDYLDKI